MADLPAKDKTNDIPKKRGPGNPNIKDHGFGAHPEHRHKGGRPKKIFTVLKAQGYSKDDMHTAFGELAWYTREDLIKAKDDKKKPQIVRIVAKQFIEAFDRGDWTKIKEILEHTIGKPKQDIGISETIIKGVTLD